MSGGLLQIDTDVPHVITYPSAQSELCGPCVIISLFQLLLFEEELTIIVVRDHTLISKMYW